MSYKFRKEVSGKLDKCSITCEELITIMIENNVKRFITMHNLWRCRKVVNNKELIELNSFHTACEMQKEGWDIETTSIWEFEYMP